MKQHAAFTLALGLALTSLAGVACAQDEASAEASVGPASAEALFHGPVLVSTVGRADGTIVRVLCQRAGVEATLVEDATSANLEGVATRVVAMGGSTKGLGAAGIDSDAELARGAELLAGAASAEIPVLGVHVGGEPRRGELSDPFCEMVANQADALIVKDGGNADQFFTHVAEDRGIPLIEVPSNGAAIEAIDALVD